MKIPAYILPVIVAAQFCCTSLWFAGNAVIADLLTAFALSVATLGHLTSAVQLGFIAGTLLFALLTVADRFSPSRVFFVCALVGASTNALCVWSGHTAGSLLLLRFVTGFSLAGIYPVGMKIAADYYGAGLGRALGYLVGALVLGTAFPHLLRALGGDWPWRAVLFITSGLAVLGGTLMLILVPDGPLRRAGRGLDLTAAWRVFRRPAFRAAAFGYFGHMWELYAFWAFVPVILEHYLFASAPGRVSVAGWSFLVIAAGGVACVLSGYLSTRWGTRRVAALALGLSGACCLLSPFVPLGVGPGGMVVFFVFWGMMVVADSPLFSTLVARNAPVEVKATALTIVNCLGFAITIISIQLLNELRFVLPVHRLFVPLAVGPLLGLLGLLRGRVIRDI